MSGKPLEAKPEHEVAYQDLVALVRKHANDMTAAELLAVASNMLGKLMALQDQRTMTPSMAISLVMRNIELGNRQAIAELSGPPAGHG